MYGVRTLCEICLCFGTSTDILHHLSFEIFVGWRERYCPWGAMHGLHCHAFHSHIGVFFAHADVW